MTYEEINDLTVESCFDELLVRLVDISQVPEGEDVYTIDESEDVFYDSVIVHESLEKPSQEDFNAELEVYQSELTVSENERLESIRKQDLYGRFNALKQRDAGIPCFCQVKSDVPNADIYIKTLVEDKDRAVEAENFMQQIESKDAEIVSELQSNEYRQSRSRNYPPIGDQLDLIYKTFYHLKENGVDLGSDGDAWLAAIEDVKEAYPKPH